MTEIGKCEIIANYIGLHYESEYERWCDGFYSITKDWNELVPVIRKVTEELWTTEGDAWDEESAMIAVDKLKIALVNLKIEQVVDAVVRGIEVLSKIKSNGV
jgi:predicted membrane chloride channel (bestrophin family)